MKKKSIKSLKLNKKSISNLNTIIGGVETTEPDDGSWYYCHSEGMGCILRTRLFNDCPKQEEPDNGYTLGPGQMGPCL